MEGGSTDGQLRRTSSRWHVIYNYIWYLNSLQKQVTLQVKGCMYMDKLSVLFLAIYFVSALLLIKYGDRFKKNNK